MSREDAAKNARFQLTNARITRVTEREKVAFLSVLCRAGKYPSYYDVTVFTGTDAQLGRYQEGDAVIISGELQMQKPREQGGKWTLQLVARRIDQAEDALAPQPRARSVRNGGSRDSFDGGDPSF